MAIAKVIRGEAEAESAKLLNQAMEGSDGFLEVLLPRSLQLWSCRSQCTTLCALVASH